MTTAAKVWRGAPALRRSLVELASLEPFPGNPRRGDVEQIAASLDRFGQVRPVLVDGNRIIAGHHVVEAAGSLGWTHVAVLQNDFENEDEQRAFLLADNRLSELGSVDDGLLAVQLSALNDRLEGTGYTIEDRNHLDARLEELAAAQAAALAPSDDAPPRLDERSPTTGVFVVPLELDKETRLDFANDVGVLRREWGLDGVSITEIVVRAVRQAARDS